MGKIVFVCLLVFLLSVSLAAGTKCRGLALEGGGDMGSFQVGVLKAFVDKLPAEEVQYDVVTGVSVGSINALAIALHEKGSEKEAVQWMLNLWNQLNSSSIYTSWPFGAVQGLLFKEGLYNNMAEYNYLLATLREFKQHKLFRKLELETVDLDNGVVYKFNESTPFFELPNAIRGSTSMPFAFPHTHYINHTFVDGGTVWNVDVDGAVKRCREIAGDDKNIIVDVILCNTAEMSVINDTSHYNTINHWARYENIKGYYGIISNYEEIMRGYPDVNFRYFVLPETALPSGFIPLGFKHKDILAMIDIGIQEGTKAVNGTQETAREKVKRLEKTKWIKYD